MSSDSTQTLIDSFESLAIVAPDVNIITDEAKAILRGFFTKHGDKTIPMLYSLYNRKRFYDVLDELKLKLSDQEIFKLALDAANILPKETPEISHPTTAAIPDSLADELKVIIKEQLVQFSIESQSKALSPPLTPANIAANANKTLILNKELHEFKGSDTDPRPVLEKDQQEEVSKLCATGDEAQLVAFLTPFLLPLLQQDGRVLVNSEKIPWLRTDIKASKFDKKPDMFVAPHYCLELRPPKPKGNADALVAAPCPFLFGQPLSPIWYDSISVLAAKKKLTGEAEGELMIYLEWLTTPLAKPAPLCFNQLARGMVFSEDEFYLLKGQRQQIIWKTTARWTQPGSAELIREFFSSEAFETPWPRSIRFLCQEFNVIPLRFLGAGATGRALLVEMIDRPGKFKVMKIACEQENVLLLEHEHNFVQKLLHSVRTLFCLPRGAYFDQLIRHNVEPVAAACLMDEVGEAIVPRSIDQQHRRTLLDALLFRNSFQCLWALHSNGIVHGDPRLPNLLMRRSEPPNVAVNRHARACSEWANGQPVPEWHEISSSTEAETGEFFWIDFAHAICLQNRDNRQALFKKDLLAFFRSFSDHEEKELSRVLAKHFEWYSSEVQDFLKCEAMAQAALEELQRGSDRQERKS